MSKEAPLATGDKVKLRDDAKTEGQPFGDIFRELIWEVVAINGAYIELKSTLMGKELKIHSMLYKFRRWIPQ